MIVNKWSKIFQDRVKTTTLDIPSLGSSALCPVTALLEILNKIPSSVDSPLFQVPHGHLYRPLKSVSTLPRPLTFHDFHRGGASWAFLRGVPIQEIQAQGT